MRRCSICSLHLLMCLKALFPSWSRSGRISQSWPPPGKFMKRKRATIIFGAVVGLLIALLLFVAVALPGRSKPLPQAQLADGRILQLEGVTFGTYHQMGFKSPLQ